MTKNDIAKIRETTMSVRKLSGDEKVCVIWQNQESVKEQQEIGLREGGNHYPEAFGVIPLQFIGHD